MITQIAPYRAPVDTPPLATRPAQTMAPKQKNSGPKAKKQKVAAPAPRPPRSPWTSRACGPSPR
eukprot:5364620-Alexandrium_andersonii.AAC.1